MRIAISGSHRVGKTTLAEALAAVLPRHELIPEPYRLLEEDGYEFAAMPTVDDFEKQLEQSLQSLATSGPDTIFDRCPLDLLGYLTTHDDADAFQLQEWFPRIIEPVSRLDRVVFVPIENPDRVAVPRAQARLRADVDAALREIVLDDFYGFGVAVIEVEGSPASRLRQVLAQVSIEGE